MNGYETTIAVLEGRPAERPPLMPITMMLAADLLGVPYRRYVTEYETLVEAQILTAETYNFDYVSCISDPAREAADCGATVEIFEDQPPAIDEINALLGDKSRLDTLEAPDPMKPGSRMRDRVDAAALFRERVGGKLLIEGWIEGPCAESADLRGINTLMVDFYDDPDFIRRLFDFTLDLGIKFAKAQVDAGVDIIGLGDAAASLIGPDLYEEFVFPYEKRLIDAIHEMGSKVRLHICGNISAILGPVGKLGADMIDIDSMVSLADCRSQMPASTVLAGNIDPVAVLRNGTPDEVTAALSACRSDAVNNYIVAAGCEVPRDTPRENIEAMCRFALEG